MIPSSVLIAVAVGIFSWLMFRLLEHILFKLFFLAVIIAAFGYVFWPLLVPMAQAAKF